MVTTPNRHPDVERLEVVVVGAGQAGLATGYELARAGRRFVVLDAGERVGDAWRTRWDSLKLFTPAEYDALPGMPFPAPLDRRPSKDEMADYLESYAARFDLPVRLGTRVEALAREGETYVLTAGPRRFVADHVVVATGAFQEPVIPAFAAELDPAILQLHSSRYRDPARLRAGDTLVVGAGQSGVEIGRELAATRSTWLSGEPRALLPGTVLGRHVFAWSWPVLSRLKRDSRLGRWLATRMSRGGDPVVGVSARDLARSGLNRVPRITGVMEGKPLTADGRALDVVNVIWATGFGPDYRWMDLPVFDAGGYPRHERGVVESEPGLYFVGLRFQYRPTSHLVGGVGADARHVAAVIDARQSLRADAASAHARGPDTTSDEPAP